jgi:hypothetical protein
MNPYRCSPVNSFTKQVEECSASDPLVEWDYSRPASNGLFSRANLLPLLAASFLPPAAVKVRVVKEERAERGELQTSGNASSAYAQPCAAGCPLLQV